LAALGATDLDALDAVGVDVLDMTGNFATLTLAQAQSVAYRGIAFAENDAITVALSAAELAALDGDDLEDLDEVGANVLDLSDDAGSVTLAQAVRLSAADIAFASGDTITLADTGSRLAGLTSVQIGDLKDLGVATLDASDDAVYLSLAQLADLKSASIGLAAGDVVTLSDDAAALSALDADGAALIADMGVDAIAVSDAGAVSLDAAAALALSTVPGLAVSGAASVTVTGTSDVITDFDEDDISALAAFGVTAIDATDDAVTVTLAQAQAVASAGVAFAGGDVVTATLTLAEAKALESATSDALDAAGVDILRLEAAPADIKALTTTEIAALG
ncbi:hypothetical protein, partial [Rhizobium sp. TRM95796]|uniref:hypothetical protein n=1 Tax=Rhizobium sp. TRM95796 TaxID=2979862 RepID=UPI0039915B43|nr:hypothetical protein [Rhizobium sp. TRM95796]